jgi:hypothetical protein
MKRLLAAVAVGALATPAAAEELFTPPLPPLHVYITPPELRPLATPVETDDRFLRHALRDLHDAQRESDAVALELSALRAEMAYMRSELDELEFARSHAGRGW